MLEIFKKLRGNKANSAADLRKALEQVGVEALEAEVAAAGKARRDALFVSDDAAEAADKRHADAVRNLERGRIICGELSERLREAEVREAAAVLDRERAAVERQAAETAAAIVSRWPQVQSEVIGLLERLSAAEDLVAEINEKLMAAGRTDLVETVEFPRARARPQYEYEGGKALANVVVLPALPEWDVAGHGEVRVLPAFYHQRETAGDRTGGNEWPAPFVHSSATPTIFPRD